ncbi:MAG: hypothetical protein ACO2PL_07055, partial [Armatimonadota bacterium]
MKRAHSCRLKPTALRPIAVVPCLNPGTVGGGLAYDEFVALAKKHGFAAVEFGIEWLEQKIASEGEEAA